jgi:hypothetical protein
MSATAKWLEAGAQAAAFHGYDNPREVADSVIAAALPYLLDQIADDLYADIGFDPDRAQICAAVRNWSN